MSKTVNKKETEINQGMLIDKENFLQKVWISIGEVAKWTDTDATKIRYWTDQGYVESQGDGRYRYRFPEIQKIKLIRYLIDKGVEPKIAADRVKGAWKKYQKAKNNSNEDSTSMSSAIAILNDAEVGSKNVVEEIFQNKRFRKLLIDELLNRLENETAINLDDLSNGDDPDKDE